jgi:hypothetical protein
VVSCPEGLAALSEKAPGVRILTAAVDDSLNELKFIVPGLGDFGDRYYGSGETMLGHPCSISLLKISLFVARVSL